MTLGSTSLIAGTTTPATAVAFDAAGNVLTGRAVTWTSSNPAVATVSASTGLVTAVAAGTAQIVATSGGQTGSASLTVTAPPPAVATQLALTRAPSTSVVSGSALAQQPIVQLESATGTAVSQSGVVVTVAIVTGSGTLGGTTTATTSASGAATFSNLSISGAAGTNTLQFTASGLTSVSSSAITVTVAVPPPPPGATEPVFSAAQVKLFQDDFDSYKTLADAVAGGWTCTNRQTTQDVTTSPAGACQIISSGYDGTGSAIRLVYNGISNGAGQEAHSWDWPHMPDALAGKPGHTFYISYYTRINAGGGFTLDQDANHIVKVKWMELWKANEADRAQFNTSYSLCTNDVPRKGASGSGTMWQFFGSAAGAGTCQAGQVIPPFAYVGAGQWHRLTFKYVTQSAAGARDGVAQMWYDGTLIVSVAQGYCGIRVPGEPSTATQNWCENADLDAMFVNDIVHSITFGSVQTASLWPFSIDYDHMIAWR
ncbi:MAG TPA: Ig-like domain-containing protein, partial [Gemmatimonadaceae bacterium]|nr:Ig-like domain-containing protein [Gemmatimonadaceae bacterium]